MNRCIYIYIYICLSSCKHLCSAVHLINWTKYQQHQTLSQGFCFCPAFLTYSMGMKNKTGHSIYYTSSTPSFSMHSKRYGRPRSITASARKVRLMVGMPASSLAVSPIQPSEVLGRPMDCPNQIDFGNVMEAVAFTRNLMGFNVISETHMRPISFELPVFARPCNTKM